MKHIFAEIGLGNDTFLSTEIEEGTDEYRVPKFVLPQKIKGIYLRFWIGKTVYVVSTNHGLEIKKKDKNKIKILFGVSGETHS